MHEKYVSTLNVRKFVNAHRSVLYGMMMGDATVNPRGNRSFFRIKHGAPQEEYMLHKYEILKPMVRMTPRLVDGKYPQWYFETAPDVEWQKLWSIFHENCRKETFRDGRVVKYKTINDRILSAIDDRGLAYWIMDDGTVNSRPRKHDSGVTSLQFSLCTHGYTKGENDLIACWLSQKYGVKTMVYPHLCKLKDGSKKMYYRVYVSWSGYETRVAPKVKPYIIPSMAYKLPPLQDKGRPGFPKGSIRSKMHSELTGDRESFLETESRQDVIPG